MKADKTARKKERTEQRKQYIQKELANHINTTWKNTQQYSNNNTKIRYRQNARKNERKQEKQQRLKERKKDRMTENNN